MNITLRRRLRTGLSYKRMKSTSSHSGKSRVRIRDKATVAPIHRTMTVAGDTGRVRWD